MEPLKAGENGNRERKSKVKMEERRLKEIEPVF
jgi:hypothetical protein